MINLIRILISQIISRPFKLTVMVSDGCNYRCKMCHIWEQDLKYMTLENFNKIIKKMDFSPLWINLSGGEPFLNPEIDKILTEASRRYPQSYISVTTNGTNFKRLEILRKLKNPCFILVSLDGDKEVHNLTRGNSKAFSNAMSTLDTLENIRKEKSNLKIVVAITISQTNISNDFGDLIDSLRKRGFLFNINIAQNSTYYQIDKNTFNRSEALKIFRTILIKVARFDLSSFMLYLNLKTLEDKKILTCSSTRNYLMVDTNLNIKDCTLKYKTKGNINDHSDLKSIRDLATKDMLSSKCNQTCESICERTNHLGAHALNPFFCIKYGLYFIGFKLRNFFN